LPPIADTGKAIAWLTTIDGLKKEIINLADEASKLLGDIEAFKPDREKLGPSFERRLTGRRIRNAHCYPQTTGG
jgi:negative regulator of sigma E activity